MTFVEVKTETWAFRLNLTYVVNAIAIMLSLKIKTQNKSYFRISFERFEKFVLFSLKPILTNKISIQ